MDVLVIIGFGLVIIGGLGLLIAAFRESLLWGLGCLLLSPISLFFVVIHWDNAKKPFLLQLVGIGLLFLTSFIGAGI